MLLRTKILICLIAASCGIVGLSGYLVRTANRQAVIAEVVSQIMADRVGPATQLASYAKDM
jgi:hypothetical protein